MLTPKENFIEMINGGKPEYYPCQFDFIALPFSDPWNATNPFPAEVGETAVDFWGVKWTWPEGTPAPFPNHGPGVTVIEDIEDWHEQIKTPPLEYSDELWKAAEEEYASIDRSQYLVGPLMFPGLFECTHNLMGMEEAMVAFYTDPDEMHELIDHICNWEIAYLKQMADHLHPDVVFHHDDWGSSVSTFLSPEMFEEFYLEPYKRLYGAYKANGYKYIIHHSDSFAATYVPFMIEMGIDVWQGGTKRNDIPALVKQYGGQIAFMTGIDNQILEKDGWTRDDIRATVHELAEECGTKYLCICQTEGAPEAHYEGFYETCREEIQAVSRDMFNAA